MNQKGLFNKILTPFYFTKSYCRELQAEVSTLPQTPEEIYRPNIFEETTRTLEKMAQDLNHVNEAVSQVGESQQKLTEAYVHLNTTCREVIADCRKTAEKLEQSAKTAQQVKEKITDLSYSVQLLNPKGEA
ncbi:hypothetical protein GOV03_04290 [Candidatus Woesearchaeota archaeon]|nr:hypothetical protein [Candidatus Woesearchaeota archaeon]